MAKKTESDGAPRESRKTVKRTTAGATAHKDGHKDDGKGKHEPPVGVGDDVEAKGTGDKGEDKGSADKSAFTFGAKADDAKANDAKGDDKAAASSSAGESKSDDAAAGDDSPSRPLEESEAKASVAPQPDQAKTDKPKFEPLLPPGAIPTDDDPEASAPPPGLAPPGDSRSLRRDQGGGEEFVFIYRSTSFLIQRAGMVGKKGSWSCVEYPHIGSASHAYAQECSRLTGEGFRDLR